MDKPPICVYMDPEHPLDDLLCCPYCFAVVPYQHYDKHLDAVHKEKSDDNTLDAH